jgi:hypothetical protein
LAIAGTIASRVEAMEELRLLKTDLQELRNDESFDINT